MGEDRMARRIPLREAADVLGISKDAVRQRIRRRTLQADKGEDGRVYVYLDASVDDVQTDEGDEGDLVDELRDRVRYLERQVEEERDARRRADTLLAQLMQRIPELEAPASPEAPEARESPETVEGEPERAEPQPTARGSQERVQRPWWRRMFGG